MDRISNAVPLSRPFARTVLEIRSGFSSTALWLWEEPTVVTIPSPTLAMMVSSPAPPTSLPRFALTVTFAITFTSIPSIATAEIQGVSMIFGVTLILTASKTFLPARSIAAALSKDKSKFALWAAISASTTLSTLPPDSRWLSSWFAFTFMPAFWALIRGRMILSARTLLSRIPTKEKMLTFTPAEMAEIHSPRGTKLRKIPIRISTINNGMIRPINSNIYNASFRFSSYPYSVYSFTVTVLPVI